MATWTSLALLSALAVSAPSLPVPTSQIDKRPDGSYSFSYNAGDHSRSESADVDLNVKGQFSFEADDNVRRQVTYKAGSDIGFLATGDHLPQSPQSSHSSHGSQATFSLTPTASRTPTAPRSTAPQTSGTSSLSGSSFTGTASTRQSGSPVEISNTRSQLNPDGSYTFTYEAATHSRDETGDSNVNVDGSFNFVADDGQRRGIQYEAGSDTGFIAEGAHIPVGPAVPGSPSGQPTGRIVSVQEAPSIDSLPESYRSHSASQPSATLSQSSSSNTDIASTRQSGSPVEISNTHSQLNPDGSYTFTYKAATHSRDETGDSEINVDGSFDFVADDEQRRTIRYEAGSDTGFIAEGAHIPVGPAVPGSPSGQPTGRIIPVQEVPFIDPLADPNASAQPKTAASPVTSLSAPSSSSHTQASLSQASGAVSTRGSNTEKIHLHQYDASEDCDKHGYVLTFDS